MVCFINLKNKFMKRYVATIDLYVYAENDNEAYKKSKEVVDVVQELDDNRAGIVSVEEVPFASRATRKIELTEHLG